jgi:hypothetical protein
MPAAIREKQHSAEGVLHSQLCSSYYKQAVELQARFCFSQHPHPLPPCTHACNQLSTPSSQTYSLRQHHDPQAEKPQHLD